MRVVATRKDQQNSAAVDPWTVVHLASGLAAGLMRVPLPAALAASIAYEAAEQFFERSDRGRELFYTSGPESVPNAIVDVIVLAAGHWLGAAWNRTGRR